MTPSHTESYIHHNITPQLAGALIINKHQISVTC